MSAASAAAVLFPVSMFLVVLALGLRTSFAAATYLFREPRLLGRALTAMYVIVPIAVVLMVSAFDLHPAVKVALVALSVSPVPPVLPVKELKLVGAERESYVFGVLVATCTLAIVIVPLAVAVLASAFGVAAAVDIAALVRMVGVTALVPLAVGIALRRALPASRRAASVIGAAGMAALLAAIVLLLPRVLPAMISLLGDGTLIALVAVAGVSLAAGHLLGGPVEDDRTVLALSAAMRHPGVAVVIVAPLGQPLAPAAVLLALLVGALLTAPYTAWRKRSRAAMPSEPAQTGGR